MHSSILKQNGRENKSAFETVFSDPAGDSGSVLAGYLEEEPPLPAGDLHYDLWDGAVQHAPGTVLVLIWLGDAKQSDLFYDVPPFMDVRGRLSVPAVDPAPGFSPDSMDCPIWNGALCPLLACGHQRL